MKSRKPLSLIFAWITVFYYAFFFIFETIAYQTNNDLITTKLSGLFGVITTACLVMNIAGLYHYFTREHKLMERKIDKIFTLSVNSVFPVLIIIGIIIIMLK